MAIDKLSVKEYEDPFRDGKQYKYPLKGGNESKAELEQSESQCLQTLAGNPWAYSPCANHPLYGWS